MRLRRRFVALAAGAVAFAAPGVVGAGVHRHRRGRVFDPNPVVTLQDETLTDQKDADYAALQDAYKLVTLTNLDGSGFLRGDHDADVCGTKSCAFSSDGTFLFGRDHTWFEQVMAYYAITQSQLYIQGLGFTNVNDEPQVVRADQFGGDNSFYDPKKDTITVGKGGVDDGEDAEVIWHELGHAIQDDQVPGFGVTHDANSIGEGFGDYWAFTMSVPVSGGFELGCIADWDSVSYTVGDARRRSRTEGSCRPGQATSRLTAWAVAVSPATARTAASHRRPGARAVGTAAMTQPNPTASSVR